MKKILALIFLISTSSLFGQGFLEGDPKGSIWLFDGVINYKVLNTSDELGLWRARESLLSPSQNISVWIFGDDFVIIEPPESEINDGVRLRLNYTYIKSSKTLLLTRPSADSAAWVYEIGKTSSGGFVMLNKQ